MAEHLAELNKGDSFPTPDLTNISAKTSPFTATEDGFVKFTLTGSWTPCDALINGIQVARTQILNTDNYPIGIQYPPIPIKKGDVCSIRTNNGVNNSGQIAFFPIRK